MITGYKVIQIKLNRRILQCNVNLRKRCLPHKRVEKKYNSTCT